MTVIFTSKRKSYRVIQVANGEYRIQKCGYQGRWYACYPIERNTSKTAAIRICRVWAGDKAL